MAVVKALYSRLPNEGHRLVLFDANRIGGEIQILKPELFAGRDRLLNGPALPFDLEIITNEKDDEPQVSSWVRAAGGTQVQHVATGLRWPGDMFALYGERDMLLVPETALLRVRYNPFFAWMTQRISTFLEEPPAPRPQPRLVSRSVGKRQQRPCNRPFKA